MEVERAARLQALLQHPSWPELVEACEEKEAAYMKGVMAGLLATGDLPEGFEYKRGFFAGMRALLRQPDVAVAVIERDVQKRRQEDDVRAIG